MLGNPNLRAQAGCTATSNFFFEPRLLDLPRVRGARARALARPDRGRLLGRRGRLARRGVHGDAPLAALRDRPDVDRRDASCRRRRSWLVAFAPEGNAAIPFLIAAQLVFGYTRRRLQHRPGQLPAGDLPAAAPGSHELGHALHRLGDDPARDARRRRARRPGSGSARRSSIGAIGGGLAVPLDPLLAAATPPRDARADRRRAVAEPVPA